MFLKSSKIFHDKNSGSSLSIIAQGIDFSGEINTEGDIHLDGKMKGNIKAQEVVIGPEGVFDGEITANILVVSGNIKGKFTVKNLHVKKDGKVFSGAEAFLLVWKNIPKYRFLYLIFKLPVIFQIFSFCYEIIAFFLYFKNRKQIKTN